LKGLFSRGLVREDADALKKAIPGVEWVSPVVRYEREKLTFENRTAHPRVLAGMVEVAIQDRYEPPTAGRFISAVDIDRAARVVVLGGTAALQLFDDPSSAVGKDIIIRGISFRVIGVLPVHLSESAKRDLALRAKEGRPPGVEGRAGGGRPGGQARAGGAGGPGGQGRAGGRGQAGGQAPRRNQWDAYSWKNDIAVIPISTAQATFNSASVGSDGQDGGPISTISEIQVGFSISSNREEITQKARQVLLHTHDGVEDFEIVPPDASMDEVEKEIRSNRITGYVIAGISLLVGGLGIVNIMLASIADRTREIGVRRALGASAGDIFRQVFIESLVIALLGGVLGIGGSLVLLRGLEAVSPPANAPVISWGIVIFGVCSAGIIGMVAGLYPALKASALNPTQALTSE
jgi:putative ABC transport system permease protein